MSFAKCLGPFLSPNPTRRDPSESPFDPLKNHDVIASRSKFPTIQLGEFMQKIGWLFILLITVGFALVSPVFSQEDPMTMMKIATRIIDPRPNSGSYEGEPKICWRAGAKYARIAEAADLQHQIHALVVIKEPDVWMVNLFDQTGRHIVDPGPSFDVHLPVFQTPGEEQTELSGLEFGAESEFFAKYHARRSLENLNGKIAERYEIITRGYRLVLWSDPKSRKPARISFIKGGATQTIEYVSYENDLTFDPSLFKPPAGITMQESK